MPTPQQSPIPAPGQRADVRGYAPGPDTAAVGGTWCRVIPRPCNGQASQAAAQVASNKRYAAAAGKGFTVAEVAANVQKEVGNVDIVVHSLANGPEVTKALLETSRKVSGLTLHLCRLLHQLLIVIVGGEGGLHSSRSARPSCTRCACCCSSMSRQVSLTRRSAHSAESRDHYAKHA